MHGTTPLRFSVRALALLLLAAVVSLVVAPAAKADATVETAQNETPTVQVSLPIITGCEICEGSHGHIEGADVTVELSGLTEGTEVSLEGNEYVYLCSPSSVDNGQVELDFNAVKKTGESAVEIGLSANGSTVAILEVQVYEAERPVMETTKYYIDSLDLDASYTVSHRLVGMGEQFPIHYAECDYTKLLENTSEGNCLYFGFGSVNYWPDGYESDPVTKRVFTISPKDSDSASIASIVDTEDNCLTAKALAEGVATFTVSDLWDNEAGFQIEVMSFADEAVANYSLSKKEITIQVGQFCDLRELVVGTAHNDYFVFKSKDTSIASTHLIEGATVAGMFCVLGVAPGDVVLTAGVLNDGEGDQGGGEKDLELQQTADFGTLIVHVVPASGEPIISGSGSSGVDLYDSFAPIEGRGGDVRFVVKQSGMSDDDVRRALDNHLVDGMTVINTLDMNLENAVVERKSNWMTVRVALTEEMKRYGADSIRVYYADPHDPYGSAEMPAWVDGDYLYMVTDHFSDYALVGLDDSFDDSTDLVMKAEVDQAKSSLEGSGISSLSGNAGVLLPMAYSANELKYSLGVSPLTEEEIVRLLGGESAFSQGDVILKFKARYLDGNGGLFDLGNNQWNTDLTTDRGVLRIPMDALPEGTDVANLVVYRIDGNGTYKKVGGRTDGRHFYFATDLVSEADYIFVAPRTSEGEPSGGGQGGSGTDESGTVNDGEQDGSSADKQDTTIAKTGDGLGLTVALLGFGVLAAASSVVMARRRIG